MSRRGVAKRFLLASTNALSHLDHSMTSASTPVIFPNRSSQLAPYRSLTNKADLRIVKEAFPDIPESSLRDAHKNLKPLSRRLEHMRFLIEHNFKISFNPQVAWEFVASGLFPNYLALFLPRIELLTDHKFRIGRPRGKKSLKEWAFDNGKGKEFVDGLKIYIPMFSTHWMDEYRRDFLKIMDCCDEATVQQIMTSLSETDQPLWLSFMLAENKALTPLFEKMSAKTLFMILAHTVKDVLGYEGEYDWLVKQVDKKPIFATLIGNREGLDLVIDGLCKREKAIDIEDFYRLVFSAAEAGRLTDLLAIRLNAAIDPERMKRVGIDYRNAAKSAAQFFASADPETWLPHLDNARVLLTPFEPVSPVRTALAGAVLRANLRKRVLGS